MPTPCDCCTEFVCNIYFILRYSTIQTMKLQTQMKTPQGSFKLNKVFHLNYIKKTSPWFLKSHSVSVSITVQHKLHVLITENCELSMYFLLMNPPIQIHCCSATLSDSEHVVNRIYGLICFISMNELLHSAHQHQGTLCSPCLLKVCTEEVFERIFHPHR